MQSRSRQQERLWSRHASIQTGELAHVLILDHLDVLAELASGAQAHIVISDVTGLGRRSNNEFWLYGTKGTLHLDPDAKKLNIAQQDNAGGKVEEVTVASDKEGIGVWRKSSSVQSEDMRTSATSFAQGVRYMEFTQAVATSYQKGNTVTLALTHY
ncbi:hypothetical protein ABBQ32_012994 [Trebouxia sp. C0010 RCD-2024]